MYVPPNLACEFLITTQTTHTVSSYLSSRSLLRACTSFFGRSTGRRTALALTPSWIFICPTYNLQNVRSQRCDVSSCSLFGIAVEWSLDWTRSIWMVGSPELFGMRSIYRIPFFLMGESPRLHLDGLRLFTINRCRNSDNLQPIVGGSWSKWRIVVIEWIGIVTWEESPSCDFEAITLVSWLSWWALHWTLGTSKFRRLTSSTSKTHIQNGVWCYGHLKLRAVGMILDIL